MQFLRFLGPVGDRPARWLLVLRRGTIKYYSNLMATTLDDQLTSNVITVENGDWKTILQSRLPHLTVLSNPPYVR